MAWNPFICSEQGAVHDSWPVENLLKDSTGVHRSLHEESGLRTWWIRPTTCEPRQTASTGESLCCYLHHQEMQLAEFSLARAFHRHDNVQVSWRSVWDHGQEMLFVGRGGQV